MRTEKCYTCKWRRYTGGGGMSSKACLISESGRTALFRYKARFTTEEDQINMTAYFTKKQTEERE